MREPRCPAYSPISRGSGSAPCEAELPELLGELSQCSAEDGAWTGAWGCGLAQEAGVCWCWGRGRTFRLSQLHSTRLLANISDTVEVVKGMNASLNGIGSSKILLSRTKVMKPI